MIDIRDANIAEVSPLILKKKPEVQALGFAIREACRRHLEYCNGISLYAAIDRAPENILDMMAADLNTQYYESTLPIELKRTLVRGTLDWYKRAGTPSAVEEIVQAVYGEGKVEEWFEYDDEPYYFRIMTNGRMEDGMQEKFNKMLDRAKNVRSHIRAIETHKDVEDDLRLGLVTICNKVCTFDNNIRSEEDFYYSPEVKVASTGEIYTDVYVNAEG